MKRLAGNRQTELNRTQRTSAVILTGEVGSLITTELPALLAGLSGRNGVFVQLSKTDDIAFERLLETVAQKQEISSLIALAVVSPVYSVLVTYIITN